MTWQYTLNHQVITSICHDHLVKYKLVDTTDHVVKTKYSILRWRHWWKQFLSLSTSVSDDDGFHVIRCCSGIFVRQDCLPACLHIRGKSFWRICLTDQIRGSLDRWLPVSLQINSTSRVKFPFNSYCVGSEQIRCVHITLQLQQTSKWVGFT